VDSYDVIVVGGASPVLRQHTAARGCGSRVLLIKKNVVLGTLATTAIERKCVVTDVPVADLQRRLEAAGVMLHL
jgi:hypothetical protein